MVFDPREQNNIPTVADLRLASTSLPSAGWTVYQQSSMTAGPPVVITADHLNSLGFVTFTSAGAPLHADEVLAIPDRTALHQNYPNPFNPLTIIDYRLSIGGSVRLSVFDLLGREIAVLVNEEKPPGSYTVTWNAEGMTSGVYFCQLRTGAEVLVRKMILQR